jgi:hypothetical protein
MLHGLCKAQNIMQLLSIAVTRKINAGAGIL